MAGLIQDSKSNATYEHSATAMKKGGVTFSGRKPLGDLSNSGNPFLKKASKKMVTKKKNFAVIEEEIGAKKISKASHSSTRKVLSDISNSNRKQISKNKQNTKLNAVTEEEPFHEKCIADERFLHNHQECLKAQHQAMEMDHFLKTVGLANGFPKELPSLKRPESPPRLLEEMLERPISDRSAERFDYLSPKSPDHYEFWNDKNDCVSFKLLDTPKLLKH